MARLQPRTVLAWSLWLVSFGCCAAGLVVELVGTRPLRATGLAEGAAFALSFPLGYASVGLVLALRRPAAAGRRAGRRDRGVRVGAADRPWHHPARVAAARRAAALAPLARGGGHGRVRGNGGSAGRQPDVRPAPGDRG